uniref:Uncharacterized protein n=1 Tax=Latimeria chalumnae TaxID=7897 RepID=H3AD21_LATCH
EPEDDNAINHILRLRKKQGWLTMLPQHGFVYKNQTCTTDVAKKKTYLFKDEGEYVFCLLRNGNNPKARYEPYDFQISSEADGKDMEVTPVMNWLYERRLFNMIINLPFFVKFRIWKAFIRWKVNVQSSKKNNSWMLMLKELFIVDVVFQSCLLYVRALCETASSSNGGLGLGDSAIIFVKLDRSRSYLLDEFYNVQRHQCKHAFGQIESLRNKIIEMIKQSCLKVADMEGAKKLFEPDFKNKPKYAEIAEWRHILARFTRFIRLVDEIFQDLLCRLINTAVRLLLEFFISSDKVRLSNEKKNETLIR